MKKRIAYIGLLVFILMGQCIVASADTYKIFEQWGGGVEDAEKTPLNQDDDLMCWAAASANMLKYSGWGNAMGSKAWADNGEDELFKYFQDHWTDNGGNIRYGIKWWFDGTYSGPSSSDWSVPDVPHTGFHSETDFLNSYGRSTTTTGDFLVNIDSHLREGSVVGLSVLGDRWNTFGHAITCWGIETNAAGDYTGVYVSDSDDKKYLADAPDDLVFKNVSKVFMDIERSDGTSVNKEVWEILDYSGSGYNAYIGEVHWLAANPNPVPLPGSLVLLLTGLLPLGLRIRGRR